MLIAYVDESGDVGSGGSTTYVLGCVLVDATAWADVFDTLIRFRRWIRQRFGVPVRAEIKANYLLHNGGVFRSLRLSERARRAIYRQHMRMHAKLPVRTFAVLIRKPELRALHPGADPRDTAWEYMLQRLERVMTKEKRPLLLIHDEGEGPLVRRLARKARRAGTAGSAFGTGTLRVPARSLVDDPVPRDSRQSYFLQLADLAAYAAYRHLYPPPATLRVPIVPPRMWLELGPAIHKPATALRGGTPGIVTYPPAASKP